MPRVICVGDIHGCSKTFKALLLDKIAIKKSDKVYCIGDYINRGKDSKGVIDFILNLRSEGYGIHTLRGNHEQMMLDAFLSEHQLNHWLKYGGKETLKSFGVTSLNEIEDRYINFLEQTQLFIATDKYIFVHAGLNFDFPNPFDDKHAMLWIRDEYFNKEIINNRLLIHGHTPITLENILKQISNRINIDGGCVYKEKAGMGNLVAISLPNKEFIILANTD